jgi:natural product precursor
MKKLGKLSINPEKVIKDNELVTLKGGYYFSDCCDCWSMVDNTLVGKIYLTESTNDAECTTECRLVFGNVYGKISSCHM